MFRPLELFVDQTIEIDIVSNNLVALHYKKVVRALLAGDFSQKGGNIDIFPVNFDTPVRIDFDDNKIRAITSICIKNSIPVWQHKIILLLPNKPSQKSVFSSDIPLNNFVDIQEGDFVVHNNHGIGRFLGIEELNINNKKQGHLIIEYQGGDKLFVPRYDTHLVQKYVSFNKRPPKIYKLGTQKWKRVRARIQKQLQRMAAELLHIQALRTSLKGFSFSKDSQWQKEFEQSFPFDDTPDQIKATLEVKKDMESSCPMDRLLCGDVGYGKTEVALRAIFKTVMDNKQAVVLVPTTILAEQHYCNFSNRLKEYPINIALLSRFRTKHEQAESIKKLAEGKIDIIIGTHRLLSKDINFHDLGLIVIDEEQRFGVKSKEKLKHLLVTADILTLTATPIPRTLYMSLTGAKEISVIVTPPRGRFPVKASVIEFDEDVIHNAIQRELKRKGQVFFLHNHIEDIARVAKIIKRLTVNARIAVAHGRMPAKLLEEIMFGFQKGEIDILVCTTIIGSGIDIPNANTLIINHSDKLGLADLHQLRGRVGRSSRRAYSYFIIPPRETLSSRAKVRIEAIEKYNKLGAGFKVAFEDMQIRGAGNLLGQEQHGHIATIGFDLYCRLLKESIENLKNRPPR